MTFNDWFARWSHVLPPQAAAELCQALDPSDVTVPAPSDRSEAAVQAEVRMVAASEFRTALWRNNNGAMTTDDGRHVRFGLGNDSGALNKKWKSSDLIGMTPAGQFVAVEVKQPGWTLRPSDGRAQAQAAFMRSVRGLGGRAGFVQSVDDLRRLLS